MGLSVVAEASKLKRRRNRIEGVIDGVPVAVSYKAGWVYVFLTVHDVPYSNVMGEPVMEIYAHRDPTEPGDIVTATREALAAFHSLSSAPPISRPVDIENVGAVQFESGDSPRPIEILGALGAMGGDSQDAGFIIIIDTSNDDYTQSARRESDFLVEYH